VAFRYGAAKEHLVDGVNGIAIEGSDDDAFVAGVCRLGCDDTTRRRLGVEARDAVRKLRPAQVAADFDDVLQRIGRLRSERDAQPALA
jgi:glycosyltransferase involved in cell wall biosynthesis